MLGSPGWRRSCRRRAASDHHGQSHRVIGERDAQPEHCRDVKSWKRRGQRSTCASGADDPRELDVLEEVLFHTSKLMNGVCSFAYGRSDFTPGDFESLPDEVQILIRDAREELSRGVDNANALVLIQRLGGAHDASPPKSSHDTSGSQPGLTGRGLVVFGACQVWPAQGYVSPSCSLKIELKEGKRRRRSPGGSEGVT